MSYGGARAQTASQLKQLLSLSDEFSNEEIFKMNHEYFKILAATRGEVSLNIANKLFIAKNFEVNDDYNSSLSTWFNSDLETVDYSQTIEAANTINSYVEKHTENMIKNLVTPNDLNTLTKLVLINAIYFKGK